MKYSFYFEKKSIMACSISEVTFRCGTFYFMVLVVLRPSLLLIFTQVVLNLYYIAGLS